MQIRRSSPLDERARRAQGPMSVDEFLARFPEVPGSLREEPVLRQYVTTFGPLLRLARKPAPCMRDGGDHPHAFYSRLVNDLAIYGVGLARRERTLARLETTLGEYRKQPATFACSLIPRRTPEAPRVGCGA
jgi:hypothetical protein